jgi:uncharacterized membrane protein HdeD (DUF308 family)
VLQQLVVDVTLGQYPKVVHDLTLELLQMRSSNFDQPPPASDFATCAIGAGPDGAQLPGGFRVYPELAAAGLWSTPHDLALMVIGILFGVYLALWGAVALMIAVGNDGVPTGARILGVLVGVLGLLAGLVLMVRPGQSVLTIVWVLGFWWCVLGVMQLIRGIVVPGGRLWNLLWGVVGIAAGAILLAWPGIGLGTLVIVVSVSLILQGFLEIGLAAAMTGSRP